MAQQLNQSKNHANLKPVKSLAARGADGVLPAESVAAMGILHDTVGIVVGAMGKANGVEILVEHHLP